MGFWVRDNIYIYILTQMMVCDIILIVKSACGCWWPGAHLAPGHLQPSWWHRLFGVYQKCHNITNIICQQNVLQTMPPGSHRAIRIIALTLGVCAEATGKLGDGYNGREAINRCLWWKMMKYYILCTCASTELFGQHKLSVANSNSWSNTWPCWLFYIMFLDHSNILKSIDKQ